MTLRRVIELPPYTFEISSGIPAVQHYVDSHYGDYIQLGTGNAFIDHRVQVDKAPNLRSLIRPQACFYGNHDEPFKPLPASQAHALLEWGMNWCITSTEANYLIIHAGVLAKNDQAIIFPAPPGSGKSTLTAYLALSGWRLLSDELALINLDTNTVTPFVRPICLKNQSIDLLRSWFPAAVLSDIARNTQKGDVAHVKPPQASVLAGRDTATIVGVVFPHYKVGKETTIYQLDMSETFIQLINNAFNYSILGAQGFSTLTHVVDRCVGFEIHYSDLQDVAQFLAEEILPSK